jgi:ribosomal protein S18 acetylase RimI-like enzyme
MTDEYFAAYVERSIPSYAAEHVKAGNWTEAEALDKARASFDELLPMGVATQDNFLYTVEETQSGETVGLIWFRVDRSKIEPEAFVYDLLICADFRRRGYGRAAMEAMIGELRGLGVHRVALHVFGHNSGAIDFYRSLGFETADLVMAKRL